MKHSWSCTVLPFEGDICGTAIFLDLFGTGITD